MEIKNLFFFKVILAKTGCGKQKLQNIHNKNRQS